MPGHTVDDDPALALPASALLRALAVAESPPGELTSRLLDAAVTLLRAERGFLLLLPAGAPADAARLDPVDARTIDGERLTEADLKFSRGVAAHVLREGRALVLDDAAVDPRFGAQPSVQRLRLRSVLCAPLRAGDGAVRGVVYVDQRFATGAFGAPQRRLLELLAAHAGLAVERRTLRESHRGLEAEVRALSAEVARAREQHEPAIALPATAPSAAPVARAPALEALVGDSPPMLALRARLVRVAPSDAPVLIQGESGTGKELVARALHALSPRQARPFVAVNCGAVTETLLESELFGRRRGAWTGAHDDQDGLFVAADRGTLFLDEVAEMPAAMQTKLLRALEAGEVRPVGGERVRRVDVRVLAATNRDLRAEVRAGRFREDLYFRLAVIDVAVPPLRARADDVPLLVRRFLGEGPGLTAAALARLQAHAWPGNVRELKNALARAVALGGGRTLRPGDFDDLSAAAATCEVGPDADVRPLDEAERSEARKALARCGDHVGRAAALLGIDRSTLYRKLKRWGMR